MQQKEFDRARTAMKSELAKKEYQLRKKGKLTTNEKDWFNLKYLRHDIAFGSRAYRWGYISTLDRAIKRLEKDLNDEERRRLLGSHGGKSNSECRKTGVSRAKEKQEGEDG